MFKVCCSDSFHRKGDAATQYNCEPYYNDNKPYIQPNPSFDLCRLSCSLFDSDWKSSYDFSNSEFVQSPSGSNTQIRDYNLTKFTSLLATWGRDSGSTHFLHYSDIGKDGNYNTAPYTVEDNFVQYAIGDFEEISSSYKTKKKHLHSTDGSLKYFDGLGDVDYTNYKYFVNRQYLDKGLKYNSMLQT